MRAKRPRQEQQRRSVPHRSNVDGRLVASLTGNDTVAERRRSSTSNRQMALAVVGFFLACSVAVGEEFTWTAG